jgi:epoxyqueuosine reductase
VISLAKKIKERAFEIGFDKIGIVPAEPLIDEKEHLFKWLKKGFHGEMRWMEREPEKRTDPRILLPGARSVIVVALNYFTPHEHQNSAGKGKVSRYAWGDDYHDVVTEKLRELLFFIRQEVPNSAGKICVDTAPIMDKAWAVRAGIGWLGKHSNVISKDIGSWFFIGEVLLNLELEYDSERIEDHCGTCTACLDACPTDAIVAPYVVDSNRCISYATIESRTHELPDEIVENLNDWLYGCDICQDVCPWNRFEKPTEEARFEPRPDNVSVDLNNIIDMEHEEYVVKFRRSAMKRAKLTGLKRNAEAIKSKVSK